MEIKGRILIYTSLDCIFCVKAKQKLTELNLPFEEVILDSFPTVREEVKRRTGRKTVPQIFFNEIHIGGYEDLMKLIVNKDEFSALVTMLQKRLPPSDAPRPPDPRSGADADNDESISTEELDEMCPLIDEIKSSRIINCRKLGYLKTFKKSFYGNDLIDWLVAKKSLDKETALNVGQKLIDRHLIHDIQHNIDETFCPSKYYILLEHEYRDALNSTTVCKNLPFTVGQFGDIYRKHLLSFYKARTNSSGQVVDYQNLSTTPEFNQYLAMIPVMQRLNFANSTINDRLAFFINVYNGLMMHGNITYGPPTNIWQRYKFFNNCRYVIGGYAYSLQDIENGILRSNRKSYGAWLKPFNKYDARLKVALHKPEPMIHFALNCGTKSCPPLKIYSSKEIKSELRIVAEAFLENDDGLQVNVERKEIKLNEIFKWYHEDFGTNDKEMLILVYKYLGDCVKRNNLRTILESSAFAVTYLPYDWSNVQK